MVRYTVNYSGSVTLGLFYEAAIKICVPKYMKRLTSVRTCSKLPVIHGIIYILLWLPV